MYPSIFHAFELKKSFQTSIPSENDHVTQTWYKSATGVTAAAQSSFDVS